MEQTSQYQFSQWAETDRIQREDFNADNFKAEQALSALQAALSAETAARTAALEKCGNCKVVAGTYTGTGSYGYGNRNTLNFNGKPYAVFIAGDYQFFAVRGATSAMAFQQSQQDSNLNLTWGDTSLSWCSTASAFMQLNSSGQTYYYVALLAVNT